MKATNFTPLASEIIVYDPDENYDYPRIKIGDGKTNINSLPFVTKDYAKISDIPTKPEDIGALPDSTVIPTVPTYVSAFANDAGYLTEHQSLEGLATEEWVEEKFEEHSDFVAQPEAPEDINVLWIDTDDDDNTGSGGNVDQNAVLYTAQELTQEQQTQARENIGIEDVFTAEVAGSSGINLNDGVYEIGRFSTSGTEYDNEGNFAFRNVNYLPVEGGRTIVVYFEAAEWNGNRINWGVELVQYDSSGAVIENKRHYIENYLNNSKSSFTLDANAAFIRIHYNRNGELVFEDMTAPKIAIYYIEDAVQEFVEYGAGAETVLMVRRDRVQGLVALAGKKIVYDGDSICAGSAANAGGGYARIIADLTGGEYVNYAVGGGRLCSGVADRHCVADNLVNLPADGDIYCFQGGINDYWGNAVLGTYTPGDYTGVVDATTVCGALETIFRYALNNFPGKRICFVITHKVQNTAYQKNGAGNAFKDYRDAMAGICQKYSVPFYDAFSESGLNGWNDAQNNLYLTGNTDGTPDGCHPNEDGYRLFYVDQLIELFETGRSSGGAGDHTGGNADQGSGLTAAQIAALDGMFKVCAYDDSKDVSGAYTAFKNVFGISDSGGEEEPDEPDVPVVKTYTISKELVNITSNNGATSVNEGASYTATLTASEGYTLEGATVTVTMGGVDVTADVYANGVITISAVTGNVEIVASAAEEEPTVELLTDGLMGYWDFRNPAEPVAKDWHWAYPSNEGNGGLYASCVGGSQGNKALPTFTEYGCTTNGFNIMRDAATYPGDVEFGTEFTFVLLTHGAVAGVQGQNGLNGVMNTNVAPRWSFMGGYYKTDGTRTTTEQVQGTDSIYDYNLLVKRVNGSELKVVMDTSECIFNGENYEGFSYWDKRVMATTNGESNASVVACALYDRPLTDVEIVELCEYFKTLEVA